MIVHRRKKFFCKQAKKIYNKVVNFWVSITHSNLARDEIIEKISHCKAVIETVN